ncbi:MAG: hypothetical protein K1X67_23855 [Fimbriimonadaceae bacterium]|nr:hypothetical protein [Fimbriimonadaceae bacterium]
MGSADPAPTQTFAAFIAASKRRRLLIDVAENLPLTMRWLKAGAYDRRCRINRIDRLVYFEVFATKAEATGRVEEWNLLNRRRLNLFVSDFNPRFEDLSVTWDPVFASNGIDDEENEGGVFARLPHGPISRSPGHCQSFPDPDPTFVAAHA